MPIDSQNKSGGDQWDPKYPQQSPDWDELYPKVKESLKPDSTWGATFQAIVKADMKGEFEHLKRFRLETTKNKHTVWVWRWALWDLHCRPIFEAPLQAETYAELAHLAVPQDWRDRPGDDDGLPDSWSQDHEEGRRIAWAFKVTALLIAGLIEDALPPTLGQ